MTPTLKGRGYIGGNLEGRGYPSKNQKLEIKTTHKNAKSITGHFDY